MKKTWAGALLLLALLATSCTLTESFDNRTATGLGPDLSWTRADFPRSTARWQTAGNRAIFSATMPNGTYDVQEDLRGPSSGLQTDDQRASVDIVSHSPATGNGHIWVSTLLGVRVQTVTDDYQGYSAEVVRTNYNLWVPDPETAPTLNFTYWMLILYRSDYGHRYGETMLGSVGVSPNLSTPQTFTLEADGTTISASFAGQTVTATDATYSDGVPGLYGFLSGNGGDTLEVVVDNFRAEDI